MYDSQNNFLVLKLSRNRYRHSHRTFRYSPLFLTKEKKNTVDINIHIENTGSYPFINIITDLPSLVQECTFVYPSSPIFCMLESEQDLQEPK